MLAGCGRTNTDSSKLSSNDQSDANKRAPADDMAVPAKTGPAAESTNQAQIAAVVIPAPETDTVPTAIPPDTTLNSSLASTSTPFATATPSATNLDPSVSVVNPKPKTSLATDLASANKEKMPDISTRLTEWKLMPGDIKVEVESGSVMRSKSPGAGEPTGPMDSMLVDQITTKLQDNADTSTLKFDVTSDNGVVTLKGTARTLDQIGRAIALSLDTGGVTQTISQITLQPSP